MQKRWEGLPEIFSEIQIKIQKKYKNKYQEIQNKY